MDIVKNFNILNKLGKGGEGTVYLVEDKDSLQKCVLKIFYKPQTKDWLPGLPLYADRVRANDLGLPIVNVIYQGDKIIGVSYPFTPLVSLHWRLLNNLGIIAQSVVGSYCRKQYYLMSRHGLAIWDPHLINFMVDWKGQWHYSDIGGGVCPLDHAWAREHGVIEYGFASLLMSLYNKNLHDYMSIAEDYSYEVPGFYCNNEWLASIGMQHGWVMDILSQVRDQKASIFYDPEFYLRLGNCLPGRLPLPILVLSASRTLSLLRGLRGKLEHTLLLDL